MSWPDGVTPPPANLLPPTGPPVTLTCTNSACPANGLALDSTIRLNEDETVLCGSCGEPVQTVAR